MKKCYLCWSSKGIVGGYWGKNCKELIIRAGLPNKDSNLSLIDTRVAAVVFRSLASGFPTESSFTPIPTAYMKHPQFKSFDVISSCSGLVSYSGKEAWFTSLLLRWHFILNFSTTMVSRICELFTEYEERLRRMQHVLGFSYRRCPSGTGLGSSGVISLSWKF